MNIKNEESMGTEPSLPPRSYARSMCPVKYMAMSVAAAPAAFTWRRGSETGAGQDRGGEGGGMSYIQLLLRIG